MPALWLPRFLVLIPLRCRGCRMGCRRWRSMDGRGCGWWCSVDGGGCGRWCSVDGGGCGRWCSVDGGGCGRWCSADGGGCGRWCSVHRLRWRGMAHQGWWRGMDLHLLGWRSMHHRRRRLNRSRVRDCRRRRMRGGRLMRNSGRVCRIAWVDRRGRWRVAGRCGSGGTAVDGGLSGTPRLLRRLHC